MHEFLRPLHRSLFVAESVVVSAPDSPSRVLVLVSGGGELSSSSAAGSTAPAAAKGRCCDFFPRPPSPVARSYAVGIGIEPSKSARHGRLVSESPCTSIMAMHTRRKT
eukprot:scaffold6184_cov129-Isochrysis_galbana.AAC.6